MKFLTPLLLVLAVTAQAASVKLGWDAPPPKEGITIAGYDLYYGVDSGIYTNKVFTPAPATSNTVSGLELNVRYFFAVTAVSTEGNSSKPSNETNWMVTVSMIPNAPTGIVVLDSSTTNPPAPPDPEPPFELTVDNPETNNVTFSGGWPLTTNSITKFRDDLRHDNNQKGTAKVAAFVLDLPADGLYALFEWHGKYGVQSTAVPYEISHTEGTETVMVNQRVDDGKWNKVGEYRFASGRNSIVRILNKGTQGYVVADAIKVVRLSNN